MSTSQYNPFDTPDEMYIFIYFQSLIEFLKPTIENYQYIETDFILNSILDPQFNYIKVLYNLNEYMYKKEIEKILDMNRIQLYDYLIILYYQTVKTYKSSLLSDTVPEF